MRLTVLGSESAGNCYLLESSTEVLILEAGLRFQFVKQALDHDISRVVGCLVTHGHFDHSKYIVDMAKAGINIYSHSDTFDAVTYLGHRSNVIAAGCLLHVGEFKVVPFLVPHGVKCFGFLIKHPEIGNLLFVTDAAYVPNKFVGLNHILVESNYSDEAMVSDRAVGHHMSLAVTMQFLRANDLSKTYNIVLLHLSASNSDAKQFIKSVQSVAPNANVMVADKGMTLELLNNPF